MDYARSVMLLNLLKDGEVHTLNEALQIDPEYALVLWQTIAVDMRNRGWIGYTRVNGRLRILKPGIERLDNQARDITALRIDWTEARSRQQSNF
jgi:hypothetical protein